jgi:hypothetical protein
VFRAVTVLILLPAVLAVAKDIKQTRDGEAKFVGAIGCKSSSCHGGAGEKRSQYITWSQKDYHTRAYTILLDARSSRIAEAVGVHEAQSSARCTVCHSPFQSVSQTRLEPSAHPDEGVSCENCHGAAEPWLRGHTRTDWTYTTRVSAGIHDLRNLYVRANACVACHQNVDTDILKAGHPPLVFELDSQSINEPKHWRDDEPQTGVRSWLIGQAVALREMSWALAKLPPAERSEVFVQWSALVWLLDKTESGGNLSSYNSFAGVGLRADEIAKDAARWNPTTDALMSMLQTLASDDSELTSKEGSTEFRFFRAQRLTLALERLSVALSMSDKTEKELSALRHDVQRHYDFDSAAFAQHLRAFHQKL